MTRKPRRLHSVPTGDDVAPSGTVNLAPIGPTAVPGWPFPLIDLSSLSPSDVETLMDRIGEFSHHGHPAGAPIDDHADLISQAEDHSLAEFRGTGQVIPIHGTGSSSGRAAPPAILMPTNLPTAAANLLSRSFGEPSTAADLLSGIDFSASTVFPATVAQALTHRYSWLLHRVGPAGLAMTGAGYLKPVDVSAAFAELALDQHDSGAGNREAHALPVLLLRRSAQKLGLLRKSNKKLLVTKAALSVQDDPTALLTWIASRLPLGTSQLEQDAGLALLVVLAAGATDIRHSVGQLASELLCDAGWRDSDGEPINPLMTLDAAEQTAIVLQNLGALTELPRFGGWGVSPEGAEFARMALARG